MLQSVVIETE